MLRFFADHRSPGGVLTRREWLRVGGLAGLGLLAGPRRSRRRDSAVPRLRQGEIGPRRLHQRRPEPARHLGPQAGRPGRDPRRLPAHRHVRPRRPGLRAPAAPGPPGPPLHHRPQRLPRRPRPRLGLLPGPDRTLPLPEVGQPAAAARRPPHLSAPWCAGCGRPARLPYAAVHVNGPILAPLLPAPGQYAGFLGRSCEPLLLGDVTDRATGHRRPRPGGGPAGRPPGRPAFPAGSAGRPAAGARNRPRGT